MHEVIIQLISSYLLNFVFVYSYSAFIKKKKKPWGVMSERGGGLKDLTSKISEIYILNKNILRFKF